MKFSFRYAWSSWLILVIAFITVFFHRLSVSAVANQMTLDIPMNAVALSNLTSMNYYAYALMQIPVGILVDTVGVRRITFFGMLLTALGSFMFGNSHSLYAAYASRFITGMGTSVILVSILKVQAAWFAPRYFSTLSGFTSFLGNFGALLATYPLTWIVLSWGWRQVFIGMASLSALLAIAILWGVRDAGEKPTLTENSVKEKPSSLSQISRGLRQVLSNPGTWPNVFILFAFTGSGTTILGLWGIPIFTSIYPISQVEAAKYLAFITAGFIAGAPLMNLWLLIFRSNRNALIGATGLNLILWAYITLIAGGHPPQAQLPFLLFLFGFFVIVHLLSFANVTAVNPLKYAGIASSITNMGEFIGSGLISLLIGYFLEQGLAPQKVLIIFLGLGILSFISALSLKKENLKT